MPVADNETFTPTAGTAGEGGEDESSEPSAALSGLGPVTPVCVALKLEICVEIFTYTPHEMSAVRHWYGNVAKPIIYYLSAI